MAELGRGPPPPIPYPVSCFPLQSALILCHALEEVQTQPLSGGMQVVDNYV